MPLLLFASLPPTLSNVFAHSSCHICICFKAQVYICVKCATVGLVLVAVQQSRVRTMPQELANNARL